MSDALSVCETEAGNYTYADYSTWVLKPGERFELIDGVAYAMAAPSDYHQAISGELFAQLYNYLRGKKCKVRSAPYDVRLFYKADGSDKTVVQPDLVVICDDAKRGKEGCRGAPDVVIEILSPSNTEEEMDRKFALYLKAKVREYWEVNPEDKIVHGYCLNGTSYEAAEYTAAMQLPSSVLDGLSIDLEAVFNA
ncbi:Uma2 family endonuclease [Breznakiellaceae bacterium SP9]